MSSAPAVEVRGLTKLYPGVRALDDVSLGIRAGACHALMGENGAGKSTLGKILAGLIQPDSGEVLLFGQPVHFRNPLEAARAGVSIVHQELIAFENLTVEENLAMEAMPARGPFVDFSAMRAQAQNWLAAVNAPINPAARLGDLPTSYQQLVLIAGALARGAKVVIFDEPTSSLSQRETEILFEQIGRLKAVGVTCIYVSHRMDEIFRLCDCVSVLRDGRHVATKEASDVDRDSLVRLMIGRDIEFAPWLPPEPGPPLLEVEGLSSPRKFWNISFALRSGEILGFAGLVGSGRSEVAEAIFGLDRMARGTIKLRGAQVVPRSASHMMRLRVGLLPEDRKRQGLVMALNARENVTLPTLPSYALAGFVSSSKERQVAQGLFSRLRVKARSTEAETLGLSGGNQQKLVLAKWLAANCDVLMLDEPTRGVDVGAKAEIHALIRDLAREGKAVLVISSELPEVLGISTRILVLREGEVVGELAASEASEEKVARLMTGVTEASGGAG